MKDSTPRDPATPPRRRCLVSMDKSPRASSAGRCWQPCYAARTHGAGVTEFLPLLPRRAGTPRTRGHGRGSPGNFPAATCGRNIAGKTRKRSWPSFCWHRVRYAWASAIPAVRASRATSPSSVPGPLRRDWCAAGKRSGRYRGQIFGRDEIGGPKQRSRVYRCP